MGRWTVQRSRDRYQVNAWGDGLFDIDDATGHMVVRTEAGAIDLKRLVDDCRLRGIRLPLLVRLPDVLKARVDTLAGTFARHIEETGYQGRHRGVFPIKVNQQRHVVEAVVDAARPWGMGLEVGSKPELQVALALIEDSDAPLIINGYKDSDVIRLAVAGRQLGRQTIIVVEQPGEIAPILEAAAESPVRPVLGVRIKLSTRGVGRWKDSSGDRAKFGLTLHEVLELVKQLKKAKSLDMLQLIHFHIGSQVSAIRAFFEATHEASRVYTELRRLGVPIRIVDVGGGLGVDYDGSRTDFAASTNYDVREYAAVIIDTLKKRCDAAGEPHPDIITETGRWLAAHSTLLVTDVVDVMGPDGPGRTDRAAAARFPSVAKLWELHDSVSNKLPQRSYHEAATIKEETFQRFNLGAADIEERAAVDVVFSAVCAKVLRTAARLGGPLHEELEHLPRELSDTYFCNFSVFQSAPDAWAVDQLFPIVPLSRHDEEPRRRAVIADLTCDSDGKIDKFIDARDVRDTLDVHALDGRPYELGLFLLGAYQETLGDLHNLFGDTHAVHVRASDEGPGYKIEAVVDGDSVETVLSYMQYDRRALIDGMRRAIESAHAVGNMSLEHGARLMQLYQSRLTAYTYLHPEPATARHGAVEQAPIGDQPPVVET